LEFFGITFEPETLETQSRALKTRIIAWNPIKLWATISARRIGWWSHQNNHKTYPNHDHMDPKPQTQILKNIFFSSKLQDVTSL